MELWTKQHLITLLPATIVMIGVAILLAYLFRNKDEKIKMIPIQVIAVLIVLLEIGKQVVSLVKGYDLYHIPLHFCSLFIFFLPLFAFYKGKGSEFISSFTVTACTMMALLFLVYPNIIYSGDNVIHFFKDYFSFHTVMFHNLVLFAFILIIALKLYKFNTKKDIISLVVGFLSYCIIAAAMAQILKTNFNNFYQCNIPPIAAVVDNIKASIGVALGQIIYVVIVIIVNMAVAFLSYGLVRLYDKIYQKIKSNKQKD